MKYRISELKRTVELPDGYRAVLHGKVEKGDLLYKPYDGTFVEFKEMVGKDVLFFHCVARKIKGPHSPKEDDEPVMTDYHSGVHEE